MRSPMKPSKHVKFPPNLHHVQVEHKPPQRTHTCVVHCMTSAELSAALEGNNQFFSNRPHYKKFKNPITNQRKFVLNNHYIHRKHHAYTVTDESSDGRSNEIQNDPPSDKRITRSTTRMLKSTTPIYPNKLNETGSIESEQLKALDQNNQESVSEVQKDDEELEQEFLTKRAIVHLFFQFEHNMNIPISMLDSDILDTYDALDEDQIIKYHELNELDSDELDAHPSLVRRRLLP
jgi:hypothetical protein